MKSLLPLLFITLLCSTYASAEAKQPNILWFVDARNLLFHPRGEYP